MVVARVVRVAVPPLARGCVRFRSDGASLLKASRAAAAASLKTPSPASPASEKPTTNPQPDLEPAAAASSRSSSPSSPLSSPPSSSFSEATSRPSPAPPAAATATSPSLKAATPPVFDTQAAGRFHEFSPRICVIGVGGAGGNAVNNMISRKLQGVEFLVCNTDAQHLSTCLTENCIQLGKSTTHGLGCGANPDAGKQAALESRDDIMGFIDGAHMVFITAGMGGGTGTGAAPVIAEMCLERDILTVAVVTKPFAFEGRHRARLASEGVDVLERVTDTLIVIPNQNIFQLIDESTSLTESFRLADDVLLAGVRSVTDLMVTPGLINLDFADVQAVMKGMGNAMMGSGVAEGENRAIQAAQDALRNPLLGEVSVETAKGMLVNITGGSDLTLFEVDKAAQKITEEVQDESANIIFGSAYDSSMEGKIRVSVVATGIEP